MSKSLYAAALLTILTLNNACSSEGSVAGDFLKTAPYSSAKSGDATGSTKGSESNGENTSGGTDGQTGNETGTGGSAEPATKPSTGTTPTTPTTPTTGTPMTPTTGTPMMPTTPNPMTPNPMTPNPMTPNPMAPAAITYADVKTKFFDKFCVGCHGDSGNVSVESYADVKDNLNAIKSAVLTKKTMPRRGAPQPSATELKLLSDWIAAGAPEK